MTSLRSLPVLLTCAAWLLPGTAAALAGPAPEPFPNPGPVTITSASAGTEAVLIAESPRARLEHRASTSGTGSILVLAGDDRLEVRLSRESLRVSRNGFEHTLSARGFTADDVRLVREALQGAPAVEAAAALLRGMSADAPAPLVTAAAFVRSLAGDAAGMRRVASLASPGAAGIRLARQEAAACWSSYQNSMWIFYLDLESCVVNGSWNLPVQYACGFAYIIQSEIAWFALIACAGGLPTH